MADKPIPPISKALVSYLQDLFPDRCPDEGMTDREVWIAAGAAKVVRKLSHEHEAQTKKALEK